MLMAAILDFAHTGHQGVLSDLFAVVFEKSMTISTTLPNLAGLSPGAQLLQAILIYALPSISQI